MDKEMILNPDYCDATVKSKIPDLQYFYSMLKHYRCVLSIPPENTELRNVYIEASLLSIRRAYEFFFKFEIKNSDENEFNKHFIHPKYKDDLVAEYFFDKPEDWKEIKKQKDIKYKDINKIMDRSMLNKQSAHITFNAAPDWQCVVVLDLLIETFVIFKKEAPKLK